MSSFKLTPTATNYYFQQAPFVGGNTNFFNFLQTPLFGNNLQFHSGGSFDLTKIFPFLNQGQTNLGFNVSIGDIFTNIESQQKKIDELISKIDIEKAQNKPKDKEE